MTLNRWFSILSVLPAAAALLCGTGLLCAIRIVREPDYTAIGGDPAVELQDSAFHVQARDCDVLIDGDSTAEVGIDPRVVTAQTGLTACNIATSRPVVDDLGTLPLDTFLEHNRKPKLLVIQYGAEDFYRSNQPWQHVGPYTPLVMIARNLPTSTALRLMLEHPAETVQFVTFVLKTKAISRKAGGPLDRQFRRALSHAEASHGQLDLNLPPQKSCELPMRPLDGPLDPERIRQLRQKYERQGIAVLIRAAPVPSCDRYLTRFEHDLAPYLDGNVEPLPVTVFASGDRHPTQPGSLIITLGLVNLINARLPTLVATARHEALPYPQSPVFTAVAYTSRSLK